MLRIGLLTSGGDCQALNAAMRGVIKGLSAKRDDLEIYGFQDGYKGLIYGNFHLMTRTTFLESLPAEVRSLAHPDSLLRK